MSFRMVASANGAVSLITGAFGLVAPTVLISLYGVTATEREIALTQMLSASYIGFAAMLWTLRGAGDTGTRAAVAVGALASWGISLVVGLLWTRLAAGLAWPTVGLQVIFTLAWTYVLLTSRNEPRTVAV